LEAQQVFSSMPFSRENRINRMEKQNQRNPSNPNNQHSAQNDGDEKGLNKIEH